MQTALPPTERLRTSADPFTFVDKIIFARGRAGRLEYVLGSIAVSVVSMIVAGALDGLVFVGAGWGAVAAGAWVSITYSIRRLHDLDRPGYWLFLLIIPLIGFVLCLWMLFTRGVRRKTEYDFAR